MDNLELEEIYKSLEGKNEAEIKQMISDSISNSAVSSNPLAGVLTGAFADAIPSFSPFGSIFGSLFGSKPSADERANKFLDTCKLTVASYSKSIKDILQKNEKTTNFTLEIIQLVAPVIAQQYAGLPALTIVGAITILCKQGITKYIQ